LEDESDHGLRKILRAFLGKRSPFSKPEDLAGEIHELVNEGHAKGLLSDEESEMVQGVLELKETEAHSIMIPRTEVSSAPADATLGEVIKLVTECGHTRIPIYQNSIDEIIGILHSKDLLKLWGQAPESKIPNDILRKPYFVPRNQKVSEILKDLKREKTHLAIVTDEYGGTAGIITIEDILEEIVGEIMDEHDEEPPLLTVLDENTLLVDARLEIEKLEEHLGRELPPGEYESVGGFIISLLGKIPRVGEKITYQDLEMTIKSGDRRKIEKILITLKQSPVRQEQPAP